MHEYESDRTPSLGILCITKIALNYGTDRLMLTKGTVYLSFRFFWAMNLKQIYKVNYINGKYYTFF